MMMMAMFKIQTIEHRLLHHHCLFFCDMRTSASSEARTIITINHTSSNSITIRRRMSSAAYCQVGEIYLLGK